MSHDRDIDPQTKMELLPHEWDGIRETDAPIPRWWAALYIGCIVFAVGYWVVYPAWPTLSDFTRGLFGWSSREAVAADISSAQAARAGFEARLVAASVEEVERDPDLLRYAMAGGRALFAENCAQCHGSAAQGQKGFPSLLDDDWLWGGSADAIEHTIRYGIRGTHPDTRDMMMPAFGTDQMLDRDQIAAVADHVLALSQPSAGLTEPGAALYAENCAGCHGADGEGSMEMGAPRLSDGIWLFGGGREDVILSVAKGRNGVMPHWQDRLDDGAIKKLTVYVHSLGGGQK